MDKLLHIRVGKELKRQIELLIDAGLFSNQAEVAREGIRTLILKYDRDIINVIKEKKKNEK